MVFDGSAREGARGFPTNVNVAAALSLAGIGPDRTELQIWADPTVTRNTHTITVDADTMRFTMTIENVPSAEPAHRQERGALDHRGAAWIGIDLESRQLNGGAASSPRCSCGRATVQRLPSGRRIRAARPGGRRESARNR